MDMIRERRNFVELEQELNRKLLKFVQELSIIWPFLKKFDQRVPGEVRQNYGPGQQVGQLEK